MLCMSLIREGNICTRHDTQCQWGQCCLGVAVQSVIGQKASWTHGVGGCKSRYRLALNTLQSLTNGRRPASQAFEAVNRVAIQI